jgi:uncharacterized tellurite resistance protein B-like protein
MLTSRAFWEGIGALAYAFVTADGTIAKEELSTFANALEEYFQKIPTNFPQRARSMFELFVHLNYEPEKAYQEGIQKLSQVKEEVRHYRFDILDTFREVIRSDGKVHPYEETFLTQLDRDLARIAE